MSADRPARGDEDEVGHVNWFGGDASAGEVVQARDVHGGVHFHGASIPFAVTPRQLPGPPHGFLNRDTELAYLASAAVEGPDAPTVVLITGTAGVGKTALALRCAHGLAGRFTHGQLYTDLRGYDPAEPASPRQVLGGFLRDLGVPGRAIPTGLGERAALFRSMLSQRRVLVVLDNAATVAQVRPLLPGTIGCLVIVTSRSRLSGLVAREGARRLRLDLLDEHDAVALLRQVTAGYRSGDTEADLAHLARLCARLPLALRIAAERAAARPLMPLRELIADLRDESGRWQALSVDEAPEADVDAVRTVFAWSYRSLPASAARLFRLLGLHPGSEFSLPAAAALAGSPETETRRDLDTLVGAHLVEHHRPDRYQLHDLLRAYALDQANAGSGQERTAARRRVLSWYLHTADAARTRISPFSRYTPARTASTRVQPLTFDGYEPALGWFTTEAATLVAAVQVAGHNGEDTIAWRLATVLRGIYMHQNTFDDWITTSRIGVDAAVRLADRAAQAETNDSLAMAYFQTRDLDQAETCHRRALELRRALGDRFGQAVSINALGLLALRRRQLTQATACFQHSAEIFAELGEQRWVALLRGNLAEALCEQGHHTPAASLARQALVTCRQLGDRFGEGDVLFRLAWAHRGAGELAEARAAIQEALRIADTLANNVWRGHWLAELARIQLTAGEPAQALASSRRAATLQRRLGDRSRHATAIDLTGQAYQRLDRHHQAVGRHRLAAAVHRELGDRWQQAGALAHLADALHAIRQPEQAAACRHQAVTALSGFDDPVAEALRQRLTR